MELSIFTRRTFLGVVLLSAFALGSGASVQLQPPAARTAENLALTRSGEGVQCFYLGGHWWCPGEPAQRLVRPLLLP
jgi:hypothetical protein